MDEKILQEIRKSHCARKDDMKHSCAGSCKITPKGIELSCPICGDDKKESYFQEKYIKRAVEICTAIGISFHDLTFSVQEKTLKQICKDYCPNCNTFHLMLNDYVKCSCGYTYSHYSGWSKPLQ